MGQDVTHIVKDLHARTTPFFGLTFEQLILLLYTVLLPPFAYLLVCDIRRRRFSPQVPAGCTKLGLSGTSNVSDELDEKYDSGSSDESKWKVKALFVYPIKSCAAVEVEASEVQAEGMTHDRMFAFAELLNPTKPGQDGQKTPVWTYRSQRQPGYEKLAAVRPEVWIPKSRSGSATNSLRKSEQEGRLIINYPNVPSGPLAWADRIMLKWGLLPKESFFAVPLNPGQGHSYPREHVTIWKDTPCWFNMGSHIPNDFKQWLGISRPFALFRVDPESHREVFMCAPRKEDVGFQPAIRFQDAYPLHLQNLASVHDVGHKIEAADVKGLSFKRFRPNILITGPPAYNEDDWKRCRIGGNDIYCSCHTTRCKLPNVDPATSERHPSEPDETMRSFRCIDPGARLKPCLGMQLTPAQNKTFQLRVGDAIVVTERGEHHFLK